MKTISWSLTGFALTVGLSTISTKEAKVTHLEILAERLDALGEDAVLAAGRARSLNRPMQIEYYHGQVVAFGRAADMLRDEALKREGVDKEVTV